MADNLPAPICVLKVNNIQCCDTCPKKLKKLLEKINGVKTVTVDAKNGLVTVSGAVDPSVLIEAIAKKRRKAELLLYEKEPNKVDLDIVSDKCKILNGGRKEPCFNCSGGSNGNHDRRDGGQKRGMKSERNVVEARVSTFQTQPPGAGFEGSDGGHNRGDSFQRSGMKEKEFIEPRPLGGFGGPGPEFAGWRSQLPPVGYQPPPGPRFAGPPMQPPAGYRRRPGLHQPLQQPFAYQHHPAFYPHQPPPPIQTTRPQHYQPPPIQQTIPPLPYPYDIYQKKNEPPQGGNPMLHLFRDDNVNSCSIS
ncbi:hypothetical protein SLEP1_g1148 [Rubroshorea leprosula]|uniref:HMA domain-containing protein n=1 Tax=Rubroshorea leprosula TaxID=152421 RepID=A0AAV5HHK9_9ROSI|nr:hypothetical protein SLEP1_g1148 [Rubroshorea leprosula]